MPVRQAQSAPEVEELFASSALTVLNEVTESWPCRQWDAEYIQKSLGNFEIQVSHKDSSGNIVSVEKGVKLAHFLTHHADRSWSPSGTIPYIDNFDIFGLAPHLRPDCPAEKLFGHDRSLVIHGGFLGPAGSSTRLHVDSEDNCIYMCFGRKLIILLPPSARDLIDFDARSIPLENPWDPAIEEKVKLHPMFRRCAELVRVVVLERGDLLIQPRDWSHWVYNLELSFSVACWAKVLPKVESESVASGQESSSEVLQSRIVFECATADADADGGGRGSGTERV